MLERVSEFSNVTWKTWWLWVFAGALAPVAHALIWMSLLKRVTSDSPLIVFLYLALFVIIVGGLIVPSYIEGMVLRRMARRVRPLVWILVALFSFLLYLGHQWLAASWFDEWAGMGSFWLPAWLTSWNHGQLRSLSMDLLPWWKFLVPAVILMFIISLPAALYLTHLRVGRFLALWTVFSAGALVAHFIHELYIIYDVSPYGRDVLYSMNGSQWERRLFELWLRASYGMAGAATSGLGLALVIRPTNALGRSPMPHLSRKAILVFGLMCLIVASGPAIARIF